MKAKILTIVGNIASGKSTVMPVVAGVLGGQPVEADDLFQTTDPFRDRYLRDLRRWSLANELWLTVERAKMLEWEMGVAGEKGKEWMVVDSGLLMSWVYMYSHLLVGEIDRDEWGLYEQVYKRLEKGVKTDVVVRMDYPVEVLLERIKRRNRDYELEFYTRKYLEDRNKGLGELDEKLGRGGVKVLRVDESVVAEVGGPSAGSGQGGEVEMGKLIKLIKEGV